MINIRRGVFETNSSSTHAIVLHFSDEDSLDETLIPNESGELIIKGADFTGIEFQIAGAELKAALVIET
jgi:hypothetical protein